MKQPTLFDIGNASDAYGDPITSSTPREIGERQAEICAAKAEDDGWDKDAATAFILHYLTVHGPTSGEILVEQASKRYPAHDARAYGSIFGKLSKAGTIIVAGYAKRQKGHGTGGANIWQLRP